MRGTVRRDAGEPRYLAPGPRAKEAASHSSENVLAKKLILTGDNSAMLGSVNVSAGILDVQNANALGDFLLNNAVNTSHDTTVQTNARLDVNMASAVTTSHEQTPFASPAWSQWNPLA